VEEGLAALRARGIVEGVVVQAQQEPVLAFYAGPVLQRLELG
jgi:hypothetical protein